MIAGRTLALPARPDPERDAVADAWSRAGGAVVRLDWLTAAVYEGDGDADGAAAWLARHLPALALPEAAAVDVGWVDGWAWALVEANAAWGAGLNGCDPERAALAIERATVDHSA